MRDRSRFCHPPVGAAHTGFAFDRNAQPIARRTFECEYGLRYELLTRETANDVWPPTRPRPLSFGMERS